MLQKLARIVKLQLNSKQASVKVERLLSYLSVQNAKDLPLKLGIKGFQKFRKGMR